MSQLQLNGAEWRLITVANETLLADGMTADLAELQRRGYQELPAMVPGNLEIDLMNAGKIGDPFYGRNMRSRACEYLHCFYYRSFEFDGEGARELVFDGIDTVADVYLNGQLVGHTDNMFIQHRLSTGDALHRGANLLLVHIKPAVIEARKYSLAFHDMGQDYNREALCMRKAQHMYGWDIFPRIVSAGIWKPVYLEEVRHDCIREFYLATPSLDVQKRTAELHYLLNADFVSDAVERYSMKIEGRCGESSFEFAAPLRHSSAHGEFRLADAMFWWPRNAGKPNLYDVTVRLLKDGREIDSRRLQLGVRTVELDRTSITDAEGRNGRFQFIINGRRIFCMGSNWVPVDSLHSRDAERIPKILPMLNETHCNIIRVWGGGVYEQDAVYDFCDRNGIMVWQDFMMGCGCYPQDDAFAERLFKEACQVIRRLRQHPSIVLWAGNNENDAAYACWRFFKRNPNNDRLTRETLARAVWMHDYVRPYLPSSPCIDQNAWEALKGGNYAPSEDHLWGPRNYFKGDYYRNSICQFASETGYHGCPSPESLRKYIPEEYLWTARDNVRWEGIDNPFWLAHASTVADEKDPYAYRIRLMANQVSTLFGSSVPNDLEDFAMASQISQAEAKKYFIERFRVTKWRRTGIIWWNIMDGCPQISDAVVDYYFNKKLAYRYIARSQEALCLICNEPSGGLLPLHAVNDLPECAEITYRVTNITTGKQVASGAAAAPADASTLLCNIPVKDGEQCFYFIEWERDGVRYSNHFMTGCIKLDYATYLGYIKTCGLDR